MSLQNKRLVIVFVMMFFSPAVSIPQKCRPWLSSSRLKN